MSSSNKLVRALYDFESTMEDEMVIKEGELLIARPGEGESWLMGVRLESSASNRMGLIPASFVEDVISEVEPKVVYAEYTYEGRDENELSIEAGDKLEEYHSGEEWTIVRNNDGIIGLVPKNYLTETNMTADVNKEHDPFEDAGQEETIDSENNRSPEERRSHGEESEQESSFVDVESAEGVPIAPPPPTSPQSPSSTPQSKSGESTSENNERKKAPQMPSVTVDRSDLRNTKSNSVKFPTSSVSKTPKDSGKSNTNSLEKMIDDSEKRLEEINKYESEQKTKQSNSKTASKWMKDTNPKVPKEEDIVRATPTSKANSFQLPPISLKKSREGEKTPDSPPPKVKGPTLMETGSQVKQEEMPLTIRRPSVKLEDHKSKRTSTPKRVENDEKKQWKAASEFRVWSDDSGQYKIEASYFGMEGDDVILVKKSNGHSLSVPMDKLCARDVEYVYKQEGLPIPESRYTTKVDGFDWLKFVLEAGVEPKKATKYACALAKEGFTEKDSQEITKRWMERKDFEAIDIILLEKTLSILGKANNKQVKTLGEEDNAMMKQLEKLSMKVDEMSRKDNQSSQDQKALISYPKKKKSKSKALESPNEDENGSDLDMKVSKLLQKMSGGPKVQHQQYIDENGIRMERRIVKVQEESFNNNVQQGFGQNMMGGNGPYAQPNYYNNMPMNPFQNQISSQPMMMYHQPQPPQPPAQIMPVVYMQQQLPPPPPPPQISQPMYYMAPPPPPPPPQSYYYPQPPQASGGYYYRY